MMTRCLFWIIIADLSPKRGDVVKINELVSTVLEEMRKMSQAKSVVGKPIEIGDTRVVPVSELSIGFGSGRGQGAGAHSSDSKAQAEGTGAGGMVQINPLGFIVVGPDGRAQIQSLQSHPRNALVKAIDLIPKIAEPFLSDKHIASKGKSEQTKVQNDKAK